jgi:hypothetical protein
MVLPIPRDGHLAAKMGAFPFESSPVFFIHQFPILSPINHHRLFAPIH